MRALFRTFPLMCVVLLVPVIPFLLVGGELSDWIAALTAAPRSQGATAGMIVALLATDIFLPIPSSVVITMAGWKLGAVTGTFTSWIGLTLGAVFGFGLARIWGRPFACWFSKPEDLDRMKNVSDRFGPLVLILTRAMPVFAEASVLIAGIHRLAWRRFLPAVMLSNFGIAIAYSAFGTFAAEKQWLPLGLAVAVGFPVLMTVAARRYVARAAKQSSAEAEAREVKDT